MFVKYVFVRYSSATWSCTRSVMFVRHARPNPPSRRQAAQCLKAYDSLLVLSLFIYRLSKATTHFACSKPMTAGRFFRRRRSIGTPNPPTNITHTNIAWVKLYGKFPMGLGIPPHNINIMLESNPLTSIMLVRGLAIRASSCAGPRTSLFPRGLFTEGTTAVENIGYGQLSSVQSYMIE